MLRCGHCGLSVTPEKHKGIVYYHCTQYNGKHGAEWLREDTITEQIGDVFKRLQVPEWVLKQIVDNLNSVHQQKMEFHNSQYEILTKEHKNVTTMMDNLYLDKLKGRITESEYDRFYQSFREEIADLDTQLGRLQEAEDNYYITAKYILELANRAFELFVSSEVEERRQLIKLVLSNLRVEGKLVKFDGQKPFDVVLNYADHQLWQGLAYDVRTFYAQNSEFYIPTFT